jgi:hypothetical protein
MNAVLSCGGALVAKLGFNSTEMDSPLCDVEFWLGCLVRSRLAMAMALNTPSSGSKLSSPPLPMSYIHPCTFKVPALSPSRTTGCASKFCICIITFASVNIFSFRSKESESAS